VLPLMFLTFMFGPAGWLAYLGLRAAFRAMPGRNVIGPAAV
jgi:hypothetical protein